ncbi:MAG: alpha/beta hydrolase [Alphaproteobacteria bacterium]|nr:alpha/beta hydrolase [Alphaproteobacteria bacterium]
MKNAILIHGSMVDRAQYIREHKIGMIPASNAHFNSWLSGELTVNHNILTQAPEMPHPYWTDIKYEEWADVLDNFKINENTVLVGHSAGGGFLLRFLSENKNIKVGQLVLVAPWLDMDGYAGDFLKFDLDPTLSERVGRMDIFYSTNDIWSKMLNPNMILDSVQKIKQTYPNINIHEFNDRGHFCKFDNGGEEFPEILEVITCTQ